MQFSDLTRLASGHVEARILQTALHLDVFDSLKNSPLNAEELSHQLGIDPRATELLLHALVAMGFLHKRNHQFSLSDVSAAYLTKSSARYYGGMIQFDASLWECWGNLEETIRTGKPVRQTNMYQEDPEETERFIKAMDALVKARGDTEILANHFPWGEVQNVLDIGSGPATYPLYLCGQYPHLHATLYDLPGTMKVTEKFVLQSGLSARIRLIVGDYRTDPIPGTYDAILLSNIIHGEGERENEKLTGKIYAALNSGGKVIIKDHILDETLANPPVGAIFSLLMLLTTEQGRCYSLEEVRRWLTRAGFQGIKDI